MAVGSVYVHAPFCARRCVYCDFAVSVRRTGDSSAWLAAIGAEIEQVKREGLFELRLPLETLYVGGGTPSLLGPAAMAGLATLLPDGALASEELEWTAEANPESLTAEVCGAWAAAGVNRISLGVQSFHEETLRWMGRLHGAEGGPRAVAIARAAGIEAISIDLIFGVPDRLGRSWDDDLRRAVDLDVPHVSLYGLTVEPRTALGRAVREGRESPVDEEQYRSQYLRAAEVLVANGYVHYEVSNFSRPGAEARHNSVYWSGASYLGLGNGAHSFAPPVRRWNHRQWEAYAAAAAAGGSVEENREEVVGETRALEQAWLHLRTRSGVPDAGTDSALGRLADQWIGRGLAERAGGRIRLTAEGWLVLDDLAVELDAVEGSG